MAAHGGVSSEPFESNKRLKDTQSYSINGDFRKYSSADSSQSHNISALAGFQYLKGLHSSKKPDTATRAVSKKTKSPSLGKVVPTRTLLKPSLGIGANFSARLHDNTGQLFISAPGRVLHFKGKGFDNK